MFNFIKSKFASATPVVTQRDHVASLLSDLNTVLEHLPTKATVMVDPNTGRIELGLPDQMSDELLALPSPDVEPSDAHGA